ncbi:unnamed protein product [Mycena citricolor]|uniref:BIR-domain-containing protein n=1 Tax=Mycena citricolor TaxID=2018698 RepID=A0AAD2HF94_9AGAR|nr:unnamed protein product [Mycena citricolor]
MEVLHNRLNSFNKQKRGKALTWNHPKHWHANPNTLAEAGFYFDPSPEDTDNATCFMCDKQVTDWTEEDDPFEIHYKKCSKTCSWAMVRCGLRHDMDSDGNYNFTDKARIPTSKAMEKARLLTFTSIGWKHDKNKQHSASSKKMAHAGFVFTPVASGDDTATCLYCKIALSNWDQDDDPMEHHRERSSKLDEGSCPFVSLVPDAATGKSTTKQPKTNRTTTKEAPQTDIVQPTKTYDGSDDEAPAAPPAKSSRKTTTTTKTPKKTTRSGSRANSKARELISEVEEEDTAPPPKRQGRSKSVSRMKEREEEISPPSAAATSRSVSRVKADDPARLFDDEEEEPLKSSGAPSRPTRSRGKAAAESVVATVVETEKELPPRPPKSKARSKAPEPVVSKRVSSRSQAKVPSQEENNSGDEDDEDGEWFSAPLPPAPDPGRAESKAAKAKAQQSLGVKNDSGSRRPPSRSQNRGPAAESSSIRTSRSRSKTIAAPSEEQTDDILQYVPPEPVPEPPKPRSKPASETTRKPSSRSASKSKAPATDTEAAPRASRPAVSRPVSRAALPTKQLVAVDGSDIDPQVVDISTDEDEPAATSPPARHVPTKPPSKAKAKASPPSPEPTVVTPAEDVFEEQVNEPVGDEVAVDEDIEMAPNVPVDDNSGPHESQLTTPPRPQAVQAFPAPKTPMSVYPAHTPASPEGFSFIPPLSSDPFLPTQSLTEEEEEMTVEDWIRHHMKMEYDRFKADGERQLRLFDIRAEEVRQAIETL